jgi:hypothetical protein
MRFLVILPAYFKRTLLRDNRADIWMNDGYLGAATSTEAHSSCAGSGPGHFPGAKAIQELVTARKQLRKFR